MIKIIIGFVIGLYMGVGLMCLMIVNRSDYNE